MAFLEGLDLHPAAEVDDETSLLRSGLLDSMDLFRLVGWIEQEIGAPVDPTSFDIVEQWDTVPGILAFLDGNDSGAMEAEEKELP